MVAFAMAPMARAASSTPVMAGQRVNAAPLRSSSGAFTGRKVASRQIKQVQARRSAHVCAYLREYPEPEFIAETLAAFPDKAIATVEEARCLFSNGGYTYLDVRPALELDLVGKMKECVNVPMMNSTQKFNSETRKKDITKTPNPKFMETILKRFPDKETKLLIACSDGTTYSIDALEALDEAGYVNLVGLKGGYYAWTSVFDNNLRRRRTAEYAEVNYGHEGDSCGIHASGAGFDRVDAIEKWAPPKL